MSVVYLACARRKQRWGPTVAGWSGADGNSDLPRALIADRPHPPRSRLQDGSGFLAELVRQWGDHTKPTAVLRDILMYMDRTFVAQHNKWPVHDLGMQQWRDVVARGPLIRSRLVTREPCGRAWCGAAPAGSDPLP